MKVQFKIVIFHFSILYNKMLFRYKIIGMQENLYIDTLKMSDAPSELKSSTIVNDWDVVLLKPAKQILLDNPTTSSSDTVHDYTNLSLKEISDFVHERAEKGPNIQLYLSLFLISFIVIGLVATSNSIEESPLLFRVLWLLAFVINLCTVSIPGRLDRMFLKGNHIKPWNSAFELATWTFSIWSIIYISELALTIYVVFIGIPIELFKRTVSYWLAANWFQALWCFCFRPEFKSALWVPMLCLAFASITFGIVYMHFTSYLTTYHVNTNQCSNYSYYAVTIMRIPLSIHSNWLAVASILTLNSWLSIMEASKIIQIITAFISVFFTVVLGILILYYSNDAMIGLTYAWALDGLSCRALEKSQKTQVFISQDVYEILSISESILSNFFKLCSIYIIMLPTLTIFISIVMS